MGAPLPCSSGRRQDAAVTASAAADATTGGDADVGAHDVLDTGARDAPDAGGLAAPLLRAADESPARLMARPAPALLEDRGLRGAGHDRLSGCSTRHALQKGHQRQAHQHFEDR